MSSLRNCMQASAELTEQRIAELRTHFDAQWRFKFETVLGRGSFGVAVRILERQAWGRSRRLAVKRALQAASADDLRNEIRWLETLGGAVHIVRVVGTSDDPRPPTRGGRTLRRRLARLTRNKSSFLVGLGGLVLVMEYLENGDLSRLRERAFRHNQLLPNRVLWGFFLCLIRAVVGMAYPQIRGIGAAPKLETIPTDGTPPGTLEHGDLHMGNVMVGGMGDFAEHSLIPGLKIIDFGLAVEATGVEQNVSDVVKLMIETITRQVIFDIFDYQRSIHKGVETTATLVLPQGNGAIPYPTLDDDLRDLLARCVAVDARLRPTLAEMLETAQNAVMNKTAATYAPNDGLETDAAVEAVLKTLVYDADT
ncbi:Uu.00g029050.m01.CDS01 [Anthostomella pinea]|uniref:Uu.00g029050.m01.CDS01 n=1 Tax=Anthostomella pinea TaxID=933095 RepID=A0AAI8V8M1_9PEZI|nr:Uu.00g029050.m01.CDS01 [Anthostomella pinea]